MRFGLHTGQHQVTFGDLRSLWRDAEAWGFDACYVFDHFIPLHSDVESFLPEETDRPGGPCLEATTTLAALARAVPRLGVGVMVAGVGYRTPGLFAQAAATIAAAAPGRAEIGIGAGWFEPDYRPFGLAFPANRERVDALERALEALAAWWRGDETTVHRVAYRSVVLPMHPSPRLWVAGTGERRILPLAARYADSWNAMYLTPEEFGHKVEVLSELCERAHRKPSSLERSIALRAFCSRDGRSARDALARWATARDRDPERAAFRSLAGTPDECATQIARYRDAGATHVTIMAHPPYDRSALALLASEVFASFRD